MHPNTLRLLLALREDQKVPHTHVGTDPPRRRVPARQRADSAEWLATFLSDNGPTSLDDLFLAATREGLDPQLLADAALDMGCVLSLPPGVLDLLETK